MAFDCMEQSIRRGEKIEIRGFGNFRLKQRDGKVARNPKTGEKITIAARKAPGFTPGKTLKKLVR